MSFQPKMTFINLPVKDLKKSMDFFKQIGFTFNDDFTNDDAACMVINEHTFSMLMTEGQFKNFTAKNIIDSNDQIEVITSFAAESRNQVNEIIKKALDAGGRLASEAKDFGFMYQMGFQDLDGHTWEVIYMDSQTTR
ncbi:glyoxalase/bleomycin resistance/extradiol dioxygenase family protein [Cytobacillus kochii]|uniref:VOC family protein n=1 Tax=Cytobacillus TaxID=2675230 RepID=UPI001CD6CCBC|nr:VOC family protein [Cytobacillus kochii]MCA1026559.1 glyoxalase/bleomycin resistance/extradiol dioxygenase family protein [Cytobacillus kochii]MDM5209786.1 glyoxalase/bleomycin resistance/extradiol dioxygenase family protein [Cytobacillus kochii]